MNWLEEFNIGLDYNEINEISRELEDLNQGERVNLNVKFTPGIPTGLSSYEDFQRFKVENLDLPVNHYRMGNTLQAYKATGYVEKCRGNSNKRRYGLNPENRDKALEFSKLKFAENAEKTIKTGSPTPGRETSLNLEKLVEDFNKYDDTMIEKSHQVNNIQALQAVRNVEYSQDTIQYLNELNLIKEKDDNYQVIGTEKDFQIARQTAQKLHQNQ